MSFFVLAIAAAHALPPILGAMMGKSKRGLWIGVAIAVLVALASGNPAFVVMDLIGIALGAWVGLSTLENQPNH